MVNSMRVELDSHNFLSAVSTSTWFLQQNGSGSLKNGFQLSTQWAKRSIVQALSKREFFLITSLRKTCLQITKNKSIIDDIAKEGWTIFWELLPWFLARLKDLTLSGPGGGGGGLRGPDDQTHSCQSETFYSLMTFIFYFLWLLVFTLKTCSGQILAELITQGGCYCSVIIEVSQKFTKWKNFPLLGDCWNWDGGQFWV